MFSRFHRDGAGGVWRNGRSAGAGRLGLLALVGGLLLVAAAPAETIAVRAGWVFTGSGDPIENGVVLIEDGKVVAVGPGVQVPDGAKLIDRPNGFITPGLVDAMCSVENEVPEVARGSAFLSKTSAAAPVANRYATPPEAASRGQDRPAIDLVSGHRPQRTRGVWPTIIAEAVHYNDPNHPIHAVPGPFDTHGAPLASALRPWESWAEQEAEVVPHIDVIDSVNLLSNDFVRLCRGGVTTVCITPDSASVIGSRAAVVKTAGAVDRRVVRRRGAVLATMGDDPARRGRSNIMPFGRPTIYTRRPTTRMGVEWVFRKAFYDAMRDGKGLPIYGADTPPRAALPLLRDMLAGKIPLRIQARMAHDILTAMRVAGEFGLKFTLMEATESYRCLDAIKAADLPVVYGPTLLTPKGFRAVNGEADEARLATPRLLHEAGIRFALTAQELRDEEGLARQAMCAVRYGLPEEAALEAVTRRPAELLGLADRVGALAAGRDGDLVVWSANPLRAESRPLLVVIDGQVVFEDK